MPSQVEIDGNDVHSFASGVGVKLHGQVNDARTSTGLREFAIQGVLHGSTAADLDARWDALRLLCATREKRVRIWRVDGTSTTSADIRPGDGTTQNVLTYVTADPNRVATATTLPFILFVAAQEYETATAGGGGGGSGAPQTFAGQSGSWRLTKTYSDAGIESRALLISFGLDNDEEANGPFDFEAVTDVGGLARFDFEVGTVLPAFAGGMRLKVGAGAYMGTHDIVSIDVAQRRVQTSVAFGATGTGTAHVGEQTTGEEAYTAARNDLLALLGVGSGGARDSTTGLELTGESFGTENAFYTVLLSASWTEASYAAAAKNLRTAFTSAEVVDWPGDPDAGPPPRLISARVTFAVDKRLDATATPENVWQSIRSSVLSDLRSAMGGDAAGPFDEEVASDRGTRTVTVTLGFVAQNTTVFGYSRRTQILTKLDEFRWKDAEGYSVMQTDAEEHEVFQTITVTRLSTIDSPPDVQPPEPVGEYVWTEVTQQLDLNNPIRRRELGELYAISVMHVYRRDKVRLGSRRTRSPVTGSPPPTSGPVTGGGGSAPPINFGPVTGPVI